MKKIFITAIITGISFRQLAAQGLLNKLKDKATDNIISNKAVTTTNNQKAETITNPKSGNTIATDGINKSFAVRDIKTTVEQVGKKVYTLKDAEIISSGGVQYWIENGEVKFYFNKAIVVDESTTKDPTVYTSEGKIITGTAAANNLKFTNDEPPCINGYGTYEDETSVKNHEAIGERQVTAKTENYLPKFTLTVNGKSFGSYTATPFGVVSKMTNTAFYAAGTEQFFYNKYFVDGKPVYEKNENGFAITGIAECSANGKFGCMHIMALDGENGQMKIVTSTGKTVAVPNVNGNYHIMNNGQLMNKTISPELKTVIYNIDGNTDINMPENAPQGKDYFNNSSLSKWASLGNEALYFSDGNAFSIRDANDTNNAGGIMPKKLTIDNKDYLVWLTIYNNGVYLCKKEIN